MPKRPSVHAHGPSEVRGRPEVMREVGRHLRVLGDQLRRIRQGSNLTQETAAELIGIHVKHLQRLEKGTANATLATLVACALAYGRPAGSLLSTPPAADEPFRRVDDRSVRPYRNALPLYSLQAAAGRFGGFQHVEPEAWIEPSGSTSPARGLFVARVVGTSMDRRIPDGAFCIFRAPPAEPLQGKIVLAQHRSLHDAEHGGHYTVKVYDERRARLKDGTSRVVEVRLKPLSRSRTHRPILLREADAGELAVIAELVEVLR